MPIYILDSSQRSALRSAAHPLKPVVLLGAQGLTEAVLAEIDRNLSAHGLIKVKVPGDDRAVREELLLQICDTLGAAPVHHLGKTFVLFRPTKDDPEGAALIASGQRAAPTVSVKPRDETFIPKKLAAAGKSAKDARDREREHHRKRAESRGTARERYLGSDEARRPSTRDGERRPPRHTETVNRPPIRPERPRRDETSGEGGAPGYERFGVRRPREDDGSEQPRRASRFEGGDRPPRDQRADRPARGEGGRPYGDRPARPDGGRSFGDRAPRGEGSRSYGDRPARPEGGRPYGDRPARSDGNRSFSDRPARSDRPAGGDERRRAYGDRPARPEGSRSYGDRPARSEGTRSFGDRPARTERSGGDDRRRPSGGDRPRSSGAPAGPGGSRPPRKPRH